MDFYSQTLYAPASLRDLGAQTPKQLDDSLGMEAYTIRRRKDASPMPLTRQTERAMAATVIRSLLDNDVLEHVEFTSDRPSGPSADLWKPAAYIINLPSGGPDPLMPVPGQRIVSAMLSAARDSLAAYRYVTGDVPFPADKFADEADAIRTVRSMARNTGSTAKLPNLGLGKDFDVEAAILSDEKTRFASGIFDPVRSFPEDTLESCLVTLDTAAGIVEQNRPVPVSFPATRPDPDFMKDKPAIEQQDLPAIAAHLCAYAVPAPRSISRSMGAPVRIYDDNGIKDIMCGFPPMARPASDQEIAEAALLPFRTAASVLVGNAMSGTLPSEGETSPEEMQCLVALQNDPTPERARRTVTFLAGLHALAASMEDPWAVRAGLTEKLLPAVTNSCDPEKWVSAEITNLLSQPPEEPSRGEMLAKAYTEQAKPSKHDPSASRPAWTPPSAGTFPEEPCIRYCDLPGLADAVARDALRSSPVNGLVRSIMVARNAPISGAAPTKNRQGLSLVVSVGEPDADGNARNPSEDAGRALDPAPDAAILQAVLSACQAVRRAEQTAAWSGAIETDEAVGRAMGDPDPESRAAKLGLDAQAEAFRKACRTFVASDEFKYAYGFDLGAAIAAWRNLTDGSAEKATDPGSAAELLDRLASML